MMPLTKIDIRSTNKVDTVMNYFYFFGVAIEES